MKFINKNNYFVKIIIIIGKSKRKKEKAPAMNTGIEKNYTSLFLFFFKLYFWFTNKLDLLGTTISNKEYEKVRMKFRGI